MDGSVIYNWCWSSPAHSFSVPSPVGLATLFCSPGFETSLFVASYDSQGYGGGIRPHKTPESVSESYVTTDGQSASLSWNKAPIWGLRPDFHDCQTVAGLLMWGALSDEMTGLSFTSAADPRQGSLSRVQVPWYSWPYYTLSDLRLPFSSPPTSCRVTVEVLEPASSVPYKPSTRTTHRTHLLMYTCLHFCCLTLGMAVFFVFFFACSCTRYPATSYLSSIGLRGNLFIESLPSNGNPYYYIYI
jgi:hypothetical protein